MAEDNDMMNPKEYLVSSEEMQRYDSNTISEFKVPALILMEQAALSCLQNILDIPCSNKNVLILAGKGNNGGDAMALARLLMQNSYKVTVCIVSNSFDLEKGFSDSAKIQYEIIKSMEIPVVTKLPDDSYDIIIDGIFGVGLNRPIQGNVADIIKMVNQYHGHKISLDVPSGVDATTGNIHHIAFKADTTITFAFLKRGLYLLPGAKFAGKIVKASIGVTPESFLDKPPVMYTLTGSIHDYLPKRDSFGHKGTFGKILLVAGNKEIGGAAILAGRASLISGCGMLRILTHKEHKGNIITTMPEAMVDGYDTLQDAIDYLKIGLAWADVIAIGPGMGMDAISEEILKIIIKESRKPMVLDADAITILSNEDFYFSLKALQDKDESKRDIILTPHPVELARICHCDKGNILENGLQLAIDLAKDLHAVIIKKDANTIICDGTQLALNMGGNSGMATAGSGDVLCGITAAIMALHLPVFDTAVISVYLHSLAGKYAVREKNEYSLIASDIINGISKVLS